MEFRNRNTNVCVSVSDATAELLGAEWEPITGTTTANPDETATDEPTIDWTVAQLKEYATDHEINLGTTTKKADILTTITEALAAEDDEDLDDEDEGLDEDEDLDGDEDTNPDESAE